MRRARFLGLLLTACGPAGASEATPIQDNSFTVEEAYNQEARVAQHILTFVRGDDGGWAATLTEEWPVTSQRHQLGFTASCARLSDDLGGNTGAGDLLLNYRFQAIGDGASRIAFAPRATLILPTGDDGEGLGAGSPGLQGNLPVSTTLGDRFVSHTNLGFNWIPELRSPAGDEASAFGWFAGQSLVWLARPRLNVLLEALYVTDEVVVGPRLTERESSLVVTPGIRFAVDRPSGLQIVPGIAASFGFGDARGDDAVLLYLSFEHPF